MIALVLMSFGLLVFTVCFILQKRNKDNPSNYLFYGFMLPFSYIFVIASTDGFLCLFLGLIALLLVFIFQVVDVPFVRKMIAEKEDKKRREVNVESLKRLIVENKLKEGK
jgi:uncharacterized membrane protein